MILALYIVLGPSLASEPLLLLAVPPLELGKRDLSPHPHTALEIDLNVLWTLFKRPIKVLARLPAFVKIRIKIYKFGTLCLRVILMWFYTDWGASLCRCTWSSSTISLSCQGRFLWGLSGGSGSTLTIEYLDLVTLLFRVILFFSACYDSNDHKF